MVIGKTNFCQYQYSPNSLQAPQVRYDNVGATVLAICWVKLSAVVIIRGIRMQLFA